MRTTQTSCPFCGSMLNFGAAISAGTMVPCLICNRSFAVQEASISEVAVPLAPAELPAIEPAPPVVTTSAAPPPLPVEPAMVAPAAVHAGAPPSPFGADLDEPRDPPASPLHILPTRPARVPAWDTRVLVLGGIVLAGVAAIFLGGLSLILLAAFPTRPAANDAPGSAVSQQSKPGAKAKGAIPAKSASAVSADVDVADVKTPTAVPDALALPKIRPAGGDLNPLPLATVPIVVKGNAAGVDQQRIDAAIAKGVAFLKKSQSPDGGWGGNHAVGYAALGGLTLLECKVPASDASVKKAAHFVRNHVGNLNATYELSLAILFLDRLGSPKDKIVIQGLALRLLAGQNQAGGWTYRSQMLNPPEMKKLLTYLKSHRPATPALPKAINPPTDLAKQTALPGTLPKQTKGQPDDPFQQLAALMNLPRAVQGNAPIPREIQGSAGPLPRSDLAKPDEPRAKATEVAKNAVPADKGAMPDNGLAARKADKAKKVAPINPRTLPMQLQRLPVVVLSSVKEKAIIQGGAGDNSNSQFALLALWAARRHDVPTEYTLIFGKKRFVGSQKNDGGWGYHMHTPTTNTMTCVGLLGLAFGHGAVPELRGEKPKLQDPAIQNGLSALGRYIGTPSPDPDARPPMENLYFLWSVERVAMLYDLKTIGGKDWYGWGAQTLLPNQGADGHWQGGRYPGTANHTDTCFALLFLKRSNLVPDLTQHLRLQMVIRDPEAK